MLLPIHSDASIRTRYSQQSVGGNSKIPSIICYNSNGSVHAVGEEALQVQQPEDLDSDEDDNSDNVNLQRVVKVEWYYLTSSSFTID